MEAAARPDLGRVAGDPTPDGGEPPPDGELPGGMPLRGEPVDRPGILTRLRAALARWRATKWRTALPAPGLAAHERTLDEMPYRVPRDRARPMTILSVLVIGAAVVAVVPALLHLPEVVRHAGIELWLLAALAVIIDARAFPGRVRTATVFLSITFTFALLLGWGLGAAVVAQGLAAIVPSIRLRYTAWRAAYNVSRYALSFAAAAGVLALAHVPRLDAATMAVRLSTGQAVAILLAGAAWFVVNAVVASAALAVSTSDRWDATLVRCLRKDTRPTLSLLALGPMVVAAGYINPLLVPLMLVPLVIVGQLTRFTTEVERKSTTDDLTGLPNRKALYLNVAAQALTYGHRARRIRDPRRMALLLLDIDQFRRVNEALGHQVGDQLLLAVAARLREAVGADGLVARLGGDEFAVLAPRVADADAVAVAADRMVQALADPVVLDGLPVDVSASIGVAIYPDHGTDGTTLLRHAETAMYDSKTHNQPYAVYTPEAEQHSPDRLALLADLRKALDNGSDELELHYQPQVDLATGQVSGAESLLRWTHEVRGFVSPEELIRIVEHTAIMRRLTARVLEDAVSQLAKWRADGLSLRISVNVSARDLHRPEFVADLENLLVDRGVPPNLLQLEITEGALMADPRRVLVALHKLDRLGVALSLDDFGTGYSSMQHLRRLPLAEVKIDKSFVLGMATDTDDAAIVSSIIGLGRALGLRVVAEGVEDEETRRLLAAQGCEVGQGWHFARPMPADGFVAWLARYRTSMPPRE